MHLATMISLCVALAACGSEKQQPHSGTQQETPPPAMDDPVADPAAETRLADNMHAFHTAVFSACDCLDRACADQARKDYAAASAALAPFLDTMDETQQRKLARSKQRWTECTLEHPKALEDLRQLEHRACACSQGDQGCQRRVADDIGDVNKSEKTQIWLDEALLRDVSVKATKCLMTAGMTPQRAAAEGVPQQYVDAAVAEFASAQGETQ